MNQLGIRWKMDGVPIAFITRNAVNDRRRITFKRTKAPLKQTEQINRTALTLKCVTESPTGPGLPGGGGFQLMGLRHQRTPRNFITQVQTDRQFRDNLTVYQSKITVPNETVTRQITADEQAGQLSSMVTGTKAMANPIFDLLLKSLCEKDCADAAALTTPAPDNTYSSAELSVSWEGLGPVDEV